jgi:hypothetical protein
LHFALTALAGFERDDDQPPAAAALELDPFGDPPG